MPNWISITVETLYEAKVAALIVACDTAALADGQENRAAGLIQGVIDEIRGAIGSCETNQVDEDVTTIPKSLRDMAVDLIIAKLKSAIEQDLIAAEEKAVDFRRLQMMQLAKCILKVEKPDTAVPAPTQSGPSTQLLQAGGTCNPYSGLGLS
jgi:hypothetical protein